LRDYSLNITRLRFLRTNETECQRVCLNNFRRRRKRPLKSSWNGRKTARRGNAMRCVQAQKLTETDITELVALCKQGRTENPPAADPQPQPLEAGHLPANPGAGASISLTAIQNVSAVNNLAPGHEDRRARGQPGKAGAGYGAGAGG
jgi:hypothetical protein